MSQLSPEARISLIATGVTLFIGLVMPLFAQ